MAGDVLFPSLSEDGWIEESARTADNMMAHFVAADFSQSYIYGGKVASFPYILAVNQGDMSAILSETQFVLMVYFSSYFQQVDVTVTEVPNGESSKAILSIVINFTNYKGQVYSLAKLLKTLNSKFLEIVDINNG